MPSTRCSRARVLTASLKALSEVYPCLQVTRVHGGDGRRRAAPPRRRRRGLPSVFRFPGVTDNRETEFLVTIPMVPVVASRSPARHARRADRPRRSREGSAARPHRPHDGEQRSLGRHRQLPGRGVSPTLRTRLEFLLAGFGWCNMPFHLVRDHVDSGALKVLDIAEPTYPALDIHVVHERGRRAGQGRTLADRGSPPEG